MYAVGFRTLSLAELKELSSKVYTRGRMLSHDLTTGMDWREECAKVVLINVHIRVCSCTYSRWCSTCVGVVWVSD